MIACRHHFLSQPLFPLPLPLPLPLPPCVRSRMSSNSTVLHDCVVEFLECLVHQLLAMREIYPSCKTIVLCCIVSSCGIIYRDTFLQVVSVVFEIILLLTTLPCSYTVCQLIISSSVCCARIDIFERCTKYGISLWQCRHHEVNAYINQVLTNSRPALEQVCIVSSSTSSTTSFLFLLLQLLLLVVLLAVLTILIVLGILVRICHVVSSISLVCCLL